MLAQHNDRPLFHMTPPTGWLNDPNGLVFFDGEYHLFYQHHPASLSWGPMHWGHAVSRDLLTWQHLPIALEPDELGMIFSGSAVVDRQNSAGFGTNALVTIFTHHSDGDKAQSLAFSTDQGRTWTKYAHNPVLHTPPGLRDFRDPKVFWDSERGCWVMLLAVGQSVWFYTSPDLKAWTHRSRFGEEHGAHGGVWETPDLVQLAIDGGPEYRWVLFVSVADGAPAGGSGTQYFVGDFDGGTFTNSDKPACVRWADYGGDFYAGQVWNDAPAGRAVWLAWMNNWLYGRDIPATSWRGAMSLPRDLALTHDGSDIILLQRPIPELAQLRGPTQDWHELVLSSNTPTLLNIQGLTLEIIVTLRIDTNTTATRAGLRLRANGAEGTVVAYDCASQTLVLDRSRSGQTFPSFELPQIVPLRPHDGLVRLHMLLDRASVEIFAAEGRLTLTNQIFPGTGSLALELFAEGGQATLAELSVCELQDQ